MKLCRAQSPAIRDDSVAGVLGHCGASFFEGDVVFAVYEQ